MPTAWAVGVSWWRPFPPGRGLAAIDVFRILPGSKYCLVAHTSRILLSTTGVSLFPRTCLRYLVGPTEAKKEGLFRAPLFWRQVKALRLDSRNETSKQIPNYVPD